MALATKYFYQNATRLSRWTVVTDEVGKHFNVILPSLGLHVLDRKGHVSIVELQSLLTQARIFAYHIADTKTNKTFMEYDKMTSDRMTFMASTETRFARDLLQTTEIPSLAVRLSLGYIGTASLNTQAQLIDTKTGSVFAENINQVVTVSRETRKPIALPEWWVEKYTSYSINVPKLVIPVTVTPADAFTYNVKVRWSDTDGYGHTNYISYIRFCEDAAMQAAMEGKLPLYTDTLYDPETKQLQLSYQGESRAGEDLTVHLWQNPDNMHKLYFSLVTAETRTLIFHCTMDFYEPTT